MAEKKKSNDGKNNRTANKSAGAATRTPKKGGAGNDIIPSKSHRQGELEIKLPPNPDSIGNQAALCLIGFAGILLAVCMLLTDISKGTSGLTGPVGFAICAFFYGLFGGGAFGIPLLTVIYAAMWKHSVRRGKRVQKAALSLTLTVLISALVHLFMYAFYNDGVSGGFTDVAALWGDGVSLSGGGLVGGFVGGFLLACLNVISWPVILVAVIAVSMFLFELTPNMLFYWFKQGARATAQDRRLKKQKKRSERAAKESEREKRSEEKKERQREKEKEKEDDSDAAQGGKHREDEVSPSDRKHLPVTDIKLGAAETDKDKNKSKDKDKDKDKDKAGNEPSPRTPPAAAAQAAHADLPGEDIITKTNGRDISREQKPVKAPQTAAEADKTPARTVRDIRIDDVFFAEGRRTDGSGDGAAENGGALDLYGNESASLMPQAADETIVSDSALCDNAEQTAAETVPGADIVRKRKSVSNGDAAAVITEKKAVSTVSATRERVIESAPEPEQPRYNFPPVDLLKLPETAAGTVIDRSVLERNGEKLVETLRSFRVDVDIRNISQGPTITRYELVPKAGVRVRSIANLVDDIALSLESPGIRIEAPIPGKSAVGIEVPNKAPAIVYLRELIDAEAFRSGRSKLTCCLGRNVSGDPVYVDIAKMPHLLIAGATGMGKSVCINSLIISMLYKATPDEVKLILIDPKKVELNVYNKLPHLLVPVVNQPKMAAGSLGWAVAEMERRFELIEEVGVRDIVGYNKITENDPQKEFLPHIVIVIDELADLMMTAPDDVESSICRLAQKARAAGMHLIIGTQRPSVDVITGLIKANIPSRIAFTVASNIDSRTIIDIAGAEKLIGRGDMLYAPVGAMKPVRVQGSFVSDSEVEAVVGFIKEQASGDYDEKIIKEIDKNARQCGVKKKVSDAEGEALDESDILDKKFYDAVDIAIEEGKVSTSLLQRRISVGYGRAAKIIDSMQKMGIVSPPDGQKPRTVRITRRDWDEMQLRKDDDGQMSFDAAQNDDRDDYNEDSGTEGDGCTAGSLGEDEFDENPPF